MGTAIEQERMVYCKGVLMSNDKLIIILSSTVYGIEELLANSELDAPEGGGESASAECD